VLGEEFEDVDFGALAIVETGRVDEGYRLPVDGAGDGDGVLGD